MAITMTNFGAILDRARGARRDQIRAAIRNNHAKAFREGKGRSGAHMNMDATSAFAVADDYLNACLADLSHAAEQPDAKLGRLRGQVRRAALGFEDELWELSRSASLPRSGAAEASLRKRFSSHRDALILRLDREDADLIAVRSSGIRKFSADHPKLVSALTGAVAIKLLDWLGPIAIAGARHLLAPH